MIYTRNYPVTAQDMAPDYRLTPSAALLFSQDAVANYLAKHHIAAFDLVHRNLMWVIAEMNMTLQEAQPYWSDEIQMRVWLSEASAVKVYFDFELVGHDGTVYVKGFTIWSILDIDTRRPVNGAEIVAEAGLEMNEPYRHQRTIFGDQPVKVLEHPHRVNASDIDMNGHVNNRIYLAIAMASAPLEFLRSYRASEIRIKYIRETFIGDQMLCTSYAAIPSREAPAVPATDDAGTPAAAVPVTDDAGAPAAAVPVTDDAGAPAAAVPATDDAGAPAAAVPASDDAGAPAAAPGKLEITQKLTDQNGREVCRICSEWSKTSAEADTIEEHLRK